MSRTVDKRPVWDVSRFRFADAKGRDGQTVDATLDRLLGDAETGSFKAGETVTYARGKGETGKAEIERASTAKKGYYYIKTENEGTILVPESELKRG